MDLTTIRLSNIHFQLSSLEYLCVDFAFGTSKFRLEQTQGSSQRVKAVSKLDISVNLRETERFRKKQTPQILHTLLNLCHPLTFSFFILSLWAEKR
ncbi:unnamed protein product [Lactuca virosa]|uniref:Uncharacterized protein n=1 Tax=Lactuca virosa TaxID=75947 RepID=A0AAU9M8F4_9ASTR|nr:unnamed protein product [Lactuca virosa]